MEGLIDMSAKTVIKEIIKAKNISQAELAEATNTTRQNLSNKISWISGNCGCSGNESDFKR